MIMVVQFAVKHVHLFYKQVNTKHFTICNKNVLYIEKGKTRGYQGECYKH